MLILIYDWFQVGSDHRKNCSPDTRMLFCTTGVLVEKIIHQDDRHNPLDKFTHIILDEVHERDKDMDFLMIVIYKYLNPRIRIILMSATIDVDKVMRHTFQHFNDKSIQNGRILYLFVVCSILSSAIEWFNKWKVAHHRAWLWTKFQRRNGFPWWNREIGIITIKNHMTFFVHFNALKWILGRTRGY